MLRLIRYGMDGMCNQIYVAGEIAGEPEFSHLCRGERFSRLELTVNRLSGTADRLPVILPERAVAPGTMAGAPLSARGQVRAYLRASGERPRLYLCVFARCVGTDVPAHENAVELSGYVCKPPVLRQTPMGRILTDLFIACNRPFGRADYLPVITWGKNARACAELCVGERVHVSGRLQSRTYVKQELTGERVLRTVCEISGTVKREPDCAD